jgi:cytochrome c-type biogenesis protein CcmH/NrfG
MAEYVKVIPIRHETQKAFMPKNSMASRDPCQVFVGNGRSLSAEGVRIMLRLKGEVEYYSRMKWIAALVLSIGLVFVAQADAPDDDFVSVYNWIEQGDEASQTNNFKMAIEKYGKAQDGLTKLQATFPSWHPEIVKFRLEYVSEKLSVMARRLQAAPQTTPVPVASQSVTIPELEKQVSGLTEQLRVLATEKIALERKLKEALSVRPQPADEHDLARAEKQIVDLKKEKELLTVALAQSAATNALSKGDRAIQKTLDSVNNELKTTRKQLEAAQADLDRAQRDNAQLTKKLTLKADSVPESDQIKKIRKQLESVQKDLESAQGDNADLKKKLKVKADKNVESDQIKEVRKQLEIAQKDLESAMRDKAELSRKLSTASSGLNESEQLKAVRLELELAYGDLNRAQHENVELNKKLAGKVDGSAGSDQVKQIRKDLESAKKDLESAKSDNADLKKKLTAKAAKADKSSESDQIKEIRKQLESAQKDLESAKSDNADLKKKLTAKEEAQPKKDAAEFAKIQKENTELKDKLAKHKKTDSEREIEDLKAKVMALEASPVVYTPEEAALLKSSNPSVASFHVVTDVAPAPKRKVRSVKDLPQGAGAIMADGQRLFVAGEFAAAEKKYQEILRQDDKNVFVLTHLANAQLAQNRLEEAEKTVQLALASDPEDPAALLLLGNLRLRQDRLKEALDALTKSAAINPTNAVTQNSLGSALMRNGFQKAAESAFRVALKYDPGFPEAHNNLALVYATKRPPSIELARWHYKKALDYGMPKNVTLEKMLSDDANEQTSAPTGTAPATP